MKPDNSSRDPSHADGVKLDTSGRVECAASFQPLGWAIWPDLSPFEQGYAEALFASLSVDALGQWLDTVDPYRKPAFSDLAPETLARIIADCAEFRRLTGCPDTTEAGRAFWADRQARKPSVVQTEGRTDGIKLDTRTWPPLTPYLGDDGRVYLPEAA